jgi:DNA-dependent RNA polymerase
MDTYRGGLFLDTQTKTRERFEKGRSFSTSAIGREALKLWIEPLAAYLAKQKPPRGLEQIIRRLSDQQLAFMALRGVLDQIHFGWDLRKKPKKPVKNPDMRFRLELGRAVRNELEYAGLLAAKHWVKAGKDIAKRHRRLDAAKNWQPGKFRQIEWIDRECAQVGDWLWDGLAEMTCFDIDDRGFPCFHADHKAALDSLTEELVFKHPLYQPLELQPAPWTSWRKEYEDKIGAAFVGTNHPEAIAAFKEAFADGSIAEHAMGVSAVERVPLKINPVTLPLVKQFGGEEFKVDVAVAEAFLGRDNFWLPIRCDFRGRFVHQCNFNYTRSDPVRSLFMFADGKPIGTSISWLEIAIANAHGGVKGTWRDRLDWVAHRREMIKACAADLRLIWTGNGIEAKERYQFAAACAEYVAADTHGADYSTHLPVWLDASSNGLQHLALMRRDSDLAEMVNLETQLIGRSTMIYELSTGDLEFVTHAMDVELGEMPLGPEAREWLKQKPDELEDIYERIGDRVRMNLFADRADPLSRFWLDRKKHLRDFCKQPVMTLMYGVTKPGMLDQIYEKAEDLGLIPLPPKAAVRLRDHIWSAIEQVLPIAVKTREEIQKLADALLKPGREQCGWQKRKDKRVPNYLFRAPPATFMEWLTPSGFPVANRYRKSKLERVVLPFLGQKVTIAEGYTDEVRRQKVKNSAVANFTHSLDAAHLVRSVNAAVDAGVTNIMTVHDYFGALAPDARKFARIRRFALAHMYRDNPLVALWQHNVRRGANDLPLPTMGNLDPFATAFSEYFDR